MCKRFQSSVDLWPPIQVRKSRDTMTVPDMSYTPREIIAKFSRGERVPLGFEGLYDPEDASPFEDDPTRDPEFDFGDYVEEKHALEARQEQAARASKSKVLAGSKREASAEELSASDSTTRETTSEETAKPPSVGS